MCEVLVCLYKYRNLDNDVGEDGLVVYEGGKEECLDVGDRCKSIDRNI
jgi:hypothetical protein